MYYYSTEANIRQCEREEEEEGVVKGGGKWGRSVFDIPLYAATNLLPTLSLPLTSQGRQRINPVSPPPSLPLYLSFRVNRGRAVIPCSTYRALPSLESTNTTCINRERETLGWWESRRKKKKFLDRPLQMDQYPSREKYSRDREKRRDFNLRFCVLKLYKFSLIFFFIIIRTNIERSSENIFYSREIRYLNSLYQLYIFIMLLCIISLWYKNIERNIVKVKPKIRYFKVTIWLYKKL